MKISLLPGFSPAIIAQNADALVASGLSRNAAARRATARARVYAFRVGDILPNHLVVTRDFTREHYDEYGFHISRFHRAPSPWIENNATLYAERPSRKVTTGAGKAFAPVQSHNL